MARVLMEVVKTGNEMQIYFRKKDGVGVTEVLKDYDVVTFSGEDLIAKLYQFLIEIHQKIRAASDVREDGSKWFRYFEVSEEDISEIHNFGNI